MWNQGAHGIVAATREVEAALPCDRLLVSPEVSAPAKRDLQVQRAALNPLRVAPAAGGGAAGDPAVRASFQPPYGRLAFPTLQAKSPQPRCHDFRGNDLVAPDPLRCHLLLRQQEGQGDPKKSDVAIHCSITRNRSTKIPRGKKSFLAPGEAG